MEVLENVWLHIRDLPFMSKEARNVTLSCWEGLIFQVVPLKKKKKRKEKKKERACREVLEAVVLVFNLSWPFIFALCSI